MSSAPDGRRYGLSLLIELIGSSCGQLKLTEQGTPLEGTRAEGGMGRTLLVVRPRLGSCPTRPGSGTADGACCLPRWTGTTTRQADGQRWTQTTTANVATKTNQPSQPAGPTSSHSSTTTTQTTDGAPAGGGEETTCSRRRARSLQGRKVKLDGGRGGDGWRSLKRKVSSERVDGSSPTTLTTSSSPTSSAGFRIRRDGRQECAAEKGSCLDPSAVQGVGQLGLRRRRVRRPAPPPRRPQRDRLKAEGTRSAHRYVLISASQKK